MNGKKESKIWRPQWFVKNIKLYTYHFVLNCRKNIESENTRVEKTNKGKIILLSTCGVCDSKKNDICQKTKKQMDYWDIER